MPKYTHTHIYTYTHMHMQCSSHELRTPVSDKCTCTNSITYTEREIALG